MSENRIRDLSVQWHITARCGNRCRHCYVYEPATYGAEIAGERDLAGLLAILDCIDVFERKWDARVNRFAVTGGDPLLHPEWADFIRELRRRGKEVSVLGNPDTLTPASLRTLAGLGLRGFQLSLDGLETVHDRFRGVGSFSRTVDGIRQLRGAGLHTRVMFTLYPENSHDLIPLLDFVATQTSVDSFCFDIGTRVGRARSLDGSLDCESLRSLLDGCLAKKESLAATGNPLRVVEKCGLLKLARFARSSFFPLVSNEVPVVSGCVAGWTLLSVLADGTVLPCRELPVAAGKLPEQSFEQVFLESRIMKQLRRPQSYARCGACDFYQHCRGCPAVVNGLTGDPFAPHPLCFHDSQTIPAEPTPIPLDTTPEQEHDLVASHFANVFRHGAKELLRAPAVREALFWLLQGENGGGTPSDLATHLAHRGIELPALQGLAVHHFLERFPLGDPRRASLYRRLLADQLKPKSPITPRASRQLPGSAG